MSFDHPLRLLLLVVPALLIGWEFVRRRHRVALPIDGGTQGSGHFLARLVLFAGLLPPLLLAVAIVILARPMKPDVSRQERELTNVELLLDVSGSMTAQFGKGTQYDAAMDAVHEFANRRKGDAFGLTIFGDEVLMWTPLTTDLSAIESAAPWLRPETLPSQFGGTEIGKAVRFSRETLKRRGQGDRMIILLTDGMSPDISNGAARTIAAELAADQIVLDAVYVGSGSTPTELYDLAGPTKGRVFFASSPQSLLGIFDTIDRMHPVRLKPVAPRQVDAFWPLVVAGLSLLGVYQASLLGVRYTPW